MNPYKQACLEAPQAEDLRDKQWRKFMQQTPHTIPTRIAAPDNSTLHAQGIFSANVLWPEALNPERFEAHEAVQIVSEQMAHRTLDSFFNTRSYFYSGGISSPNTAFTAGSRLSPHLAWGTLSPRIVYQQLINQIKAPRSTEHPRQWQRSLRSFKSRLHWRDHFIQRLESEPEMEFRAIHPAYRSLSYSEQHREVYLEAWKQGLTGFPLVDAVMRCLRSTGFVNFRMRAMVVSFACHLLRLDWRWIQPHLAQVFRDYEPGIHFSQLQMQAGVTGINTLRVYNPLRQLMVHDIELRFVHRWVPELKEASILDVTTQQLQCYNYPPALVDFEAASASTREQLYTLLSRYRHSELTQQVFKKHGSRRKKHKGHG